MSAFRGFKMFQIIFVAALFGTTLAAEAPGLDPCDMEHDLVCPESWDLKETCGRVNCYRSLDVPTPQIHIKSLASDLCAQKFKGSKTLSIHCDEENDFVCESSEAVATAPSPEAPKCDLEYIMQIFREIW